MHFNISHSTVKDILSRDLGLRKFSRKWAPYQLSDRQKTFRVDTSVELLALPDQYSELQFEGIATRDELWVCSLIESASMFACRREELLPSLTPGISKKDDSGVSRSAAVNCPGCPPEREEMQPRILRSEHISVFAE
jgi:hypothetical protein